MLSLLNSDRGNDMLFGVLRSEYRRVGIDNSHGGFDHHPSQNYPHPTLQRPIEGIYYNYVK